MSDAQEDEGTFLVSNVLQPSATLFYGRKPQGQGSGDVESLASYILSLAFAHRVAPSVLLFHLWEEEKETWRQTPWSENTRFATFGYLKQLVFRLQSATGRTDLDLTTLLPVRHLVNGRGLMFGRRRFCLDCCREDLAKKSEISYGRLYWSMAAVRCCPIHQSYLSSEDTCKRERRPSSPVRPVNAFGVCGHCGSLGYRCMPSPRSKPSEHELLRARQCRDVVGTLPQLAGFELANVKAAICAYARQHDGFAQLAEDAGLNKSTMSRWLNVPSAKLTFALVLDLADAMGVGLCDLLQGETGNGTAL